MSKPRNYRAAAKAKRGHDIDKNRNLGRQITRHQQAWFDDWLQRASVQDTAESYQRDAIADAQPSIEQINGDRSH
jgi:endonuclease I